MNIPSTSPPREVGPGQLDQCRPGANLRGGGNFMGGGGMLKIYNYFYYILVGFEPGWTRWNLLQCNAMQCNTIVGRVEASYIFTNKKHFPREGVTSVRHTRQWKWRTGHSPGTAALPCGTQCPPTRWRWRLRRTGNWRTRRNELLAKQPNFIEKLSTLCGNMLLRATYLKSMVPLKNEAQLLPLCKIYGGTDESPGI